MKVIEGDNIYYYDCDDTLVMWDNIYKKYEEDGVTPTNAIQCIAPYSTMIFELVPHDQHIHHLKESSKHGVTIIVWSAGGYQWAEEVVKKLGLEDYVDAVMSKPSKYIDDLNCKEFMGERIYKHMKKPNE